MLVAKDLHLGRRFDDDAHLPDADEVRNIYRCAGMFQTIGRCRRRPISRKSFAESIVDLDGGTLRTLLTLTLVLFVVLIPFVGFGEPQRIMGEGKLKQMFFYPRSQSHSIREAA